MTDKNIMNYKELLIKYIEYVDDCEGSNFISQTPYRLANDFFTEDEWKELNELVNL